MPLKSRKSRALKLRFQLYGPLKRLSRKTVADTSVLPGKDKVKHGTSDAAVTECSKGKVTSADQPTEIRVCASRSQDTLRFGQNRNKQCACNCLTFLAFLHENENITEADLDLVLDKGDVFYQYTVRRHTTDGTGHLATDELPDLVPSRSSCLAADLTQLSLYGTFGNPPLEAVETFRPLVSGLACLVSNVQYALLVMARVCIAVFRTASGRFGFFDPHTRRDDGSFMESGGTGTAVMVTFAHASDMVDRLLHCYKLLGVSSMEAYELKPVVFDRTNTPSLKTVITKSAVMPVFGHTTCGQKHVDKVILKSISGETFTPLNQQVHATSVQNQSALDKRQAVLKELAPKLLKRNQQERRKLLRRALASVGLSSVRKDNQKRRPRQYTTSPFGKPEVFRQRQISYIAQKDIHDQAYLRKHKLLERQIMQARCKSNVTFGTVHMMNCALKIRCKYWKIDINSLMRKAIATFGAGPTYAYTVFPESVPHQVKLCTKSKHMKNSYSVSCCLHEKFDDCNDGCRNGQQSKVRTGWKKMWVCRTCHKSCQTWSRHLPRIETKS